MPDIHVQSAGRNELRVIYHIPIPDVNNEAGVSYRKALVKSGAGGTTVLPDAKDGSNPEGWEIGTAEKNGILDGSLYEVSRSIHVLPAEYEDSASLSDKVKADYTEWSGVLKTRLQHGLRFWGAGLNT